MPPRSRSSSLSSLSSVESQDGTIFTARILHAPENQTEKQKKEEKPEFEVVIDSKLTPTESDGVEYETFPEETESTTESGAKVKNEEDAVEDDEEIVPDHYYGGGKIPVFKPSMKQFESFKKFVDKINHYGMRSGIVKIIAPKEWLDSLPALDDKVKDIKIKNPIVQHINGNSGTYRQANVEKQRTYNLPEWRKLCEGADHQPPARRGERRLGQAPKKVHKAVGTKRGRKAKNAEEPESKTTTNGGPLTPKDEDEEMEDLDEETPALKTDSHGRQPRKKATSPEAVDSHGRQPRTKRRSARRSGNHDDYVDDSVWEGFDYRIHDAEEYTAERCEELERAYWRTLTYNNPLYGADMPGSLFDDSTTSWNVAKLENLLDCIGQKLPGVNTAYLYLGMWKSTFAWHLEDVDLYSINYIHFGAPKQWYSISQEDAPKFEQVMKNIWPQEARKCDQFLRHKTFLVSPALLQQHGIRVNKLVHHQGEFVITFPYGYHSGYNLGYNCAESVNFATESWLEYGKTAKKCHCIDDAVWVDVNEIERRLRGEVTEDEYEYDDDEELEDLDAEAVELSVPPESMEVKPRKKRQRAVGDEKEPKKRIRKVNFKINVAAQRDHCILCPNNMPTEEMLPTDNGKKAHRLCAIYTPETYFATDPITGKEIINNIAGIPKSRLELRCMFCKVARQGACFQCTAKKCIRGYHATCAAAAGVLVEMRDGWVEDPSASGKYVMQTIIDFQCKYHRPKRDKNLDGEALEENQGIQDFGRSLIKGDVIQMQFYRQEIFAGVVVENRLSEGMVLVDVLPKGGLMEVEWKWILATDPTTSVVGTEPYPVNAATSTNGKQPTFPKTVPETDDPFCEGHSGFKWAEFVLHQVERNPYQEAVDPKKNFWYYLGEQSTEAIPKYSADPAKRVHCSESVSWMVPPKPVKAKPSRSRAVGSAAVAPPPPPPPNGHSYPYPYYHTYQLGQQNPHPQPPPPPQGQWPVYQQYFQYPPPPASHQQPPHPHQQPLAPHQPHSQGPPHPQHNPHGQQPHPQYHWYPPPPSQQFQCHPGQPMPTPPPSQQQPVYWYPPPPPQFSPGGHQGHPPQTTQPPTPAQHQPPQQASRPTAQMSYTSYSSTRLTKEQQVQQIQENEQRMTKEKENQDSNGGVITPKLNTPPQRHPAAQNQTFNPPLGAATVPQQSLPTPPHSQQHLQQDPQTHGKQPQAPAPAEQQTTKPPSVLVDTPRTVPPIARPIGPPPSTIVSTASASPIHRIPTPVQPLTAVGSS